MNASWLRAALPRIVLSPSFFLVIVFVYGFIAYTGWLSFTDSKMLPSNNLVGLENYEKLFRLRHWNTALNNLAVFGTLYIGICSVLGLTLAIFWIKRFAAKA